jgi:MerC mercury resistance protein
VGKTAPDPDKVGMVASSICAVHCVVLAVLLGVLPSISGAFHSIWIDAIFIGIALVAGSFAVVKGFRSHRMAWLPVLFAIGFGFLCLSLLRHSQAEEHTSPPYFSIIGGCCLVAFHWLNRKFQQQCLLG